MGETEFFIHVGGGVGWSGGAVEVGVGWSGGAAEVQGDGGGWPAEVEGDEGGRPTEMQGVAEEGGVLEGRWVADGQTVGG
ncbi:hypothetical protein Hanom_Chr05g00391001 [Helianthus anomalus]